MSIGARIAKARKAKGYTVSKLAQRAGIPKKEIDDFESGITMPSSYHVLRLAKSLNVRSDYLFRPAIITEENIEWT